MSSNKRLCLISDSMKRQSFSERICDDLSEVILQYLKLEDKLRLECVSKHFQRTIFVKQTEIVSDSPWRIFNNTRISILKELKIFEILLKKCQNINKISLSGVLFAFKKYNKIIDIIIKNCNNLTHFEIIFNQMPEITQKEIKQKFGSKVIIKHGEDSLSKCIFNELNMDTLCISPPFDGLPQLKFTRLDRLELHDLEDTENLDPFEVFIERNKHFIKYLTIDCLQIKDNFISKLKNLVELKLHSLGIDLNDNQWTQIALNCPQLKSIECRLLMDSNDCLINDSLMSSLKQIKSLKRLKIFIKYEKSNEILINENNEKFSFKAFKGFEGLTHLAIVWYFSHKVISETILTDIDINLPNLQDLILGSFNFNNKIIATEWTAHILSRLRKLQTIEIQIKKSVQPLIKSRLQNSIKIKNIVFEPNLEIKWK